ncbi:MAG: hypothetical protein H6661_08905 [Ardenticatenaceae bacterium]|nr:hypothetical protein [Ardenticatenaceae bacterium]
MNTLTNTFSSSKIIYCGLGLALTLLSGFILSKLGRPLNSAIFTVHKLIAVGTVILIGVSIREWVKAVDVSAFFPVIVGVTGLLFLALVVSGALLSFDKLAVPPILMIHQIVPLLAVAFTMITVYLLAGNKS